MKEFNVEELKTTIGHLLWKRDEKLNDLGI